MERNAPIDEPRDGDTVDLRRYIYVLAERVWWFVGFLVAVLSVVLIYNGLQTPVYETRTTLLIDTKARGGAASSEQDAVSALAGLSPSRTIQTQIEIIKSPTRTRNAAAIVAARVLTDLAYATDGEDEASADAIDPPVDISPEARDALLPWVQRLSAAGVDSDTAAILLVGYAHGDDDGNGEYPPDFADAEKWLPPGLKAELEQGLDREARRWLPAVAARCRSLLRSSSVQGVRYTDVVAISTRSTVPELAALYADAIAQEHIWQSLKINRQAAKRGAKWVGDRRDETEVELQERQDELRALLAAHGLTSVPQTAAALAARADSLEDRVASLRASLQAAQAGLSGIQAQLSEQTNTVVASTTTTPNPAVTDLSDRLTALEEERTALLEKVTSAHHSVGEIDGRISRLQRQLRDEVDRYITSETKVQNPLGQELVSDVVRQEVAVIADQAQLAATEAALADVRAELGRLPEIEQQTAEVEREVNVAEGKYLTLLNTYQSLSLAQATEVAGADILDHARVPGAPILPNKRLNLILAILVGCIGGLLLAVLVDYLDNTIKDPQEFERLFGLPVLAIIPRVKRTESPVLGTAGTGHGLAEPYRSLRANVRYAVPDQSLKCLLITSPGVGDGKTTVSMNLGTVCGELGQTVNLVETDLRRPAVASTLGLSGDVGLTSCIIGEQSIDNALQPTPNENVALLGSGPVPPNAALILESEGMRALLQELRTRADLTILDSPPVGLIADAQTLAALADGIILVVELGKTRRPVLERSLDLLRRTGTPVLGVVLNKAVARRGGYGYYYYYYYGGYYGYGSDEEKTSSAE